MTKEDSNTNIVVEVEVQFAAQESSIEHGYWVYHYHITIHNHGNESAQLMTRHWIVTDGDQRVQEVHGEGVIGKKPYLRPNDEFQYTSRVVINTPIGSMQGSFQMVTEQGECFDVAIQPFTLAPPRTLH